MQSTPSVKSIMPRCKVTTILTEADKSDVIYRLFLFAANPNENKKEEWGVKIGNGDYDFGVRPTEHSARVLRRKSNFVRLKTYLI